MERKLRLIRGAARIAERALADSLFLLKPGISEKDISRQLYRRVKFHGGDGFSFRPIVASGGRSALPHGRASEKKLRRGEIVVVDFGVRLGGFCSDMTRSFVIGKPSRKQSRIYGTLISAQNAAVKKIKDGARACDIDRAAREVINKRGFGPSFIHSTGHGIGRKVHEPPKISRKNRNMVRSGTIVTVEPGIYIKGWGGMRVEDMFLVRRSGSLPLTAFPRGLK